MLILIMGRKEPKRLHKKVNCEKEELQPRKRRRAETAMQATQVASAIIPSKACDPSEGGVEQDSLPLQLRQSLENLLERRGSSSFF